MPVLSSLTVNNALRLVVDHCNQLKDKDLSSEVVSLRESYGRILAESVYLDTDQPPFDRSMRDGYAVLSEDIQKLPARLKYLGEVKAGEVSSLRLKKGEALQIMTGAPVPAGADAVVMVEYTERPNSDEVTILKSSISKSNIALKGSERKVGDLLVSKGDRLGSIELGGLASVGKSQISLFKRPTVGILATGDELVEVDEKPGPGQIRNSNAYLLYSQVLKMGGIPKILQTATDNIKDLTNQINKGLRNDVLLISGGVSMGKYDLVEPVMSELGIQIYFESVTMRPGKPTVFARKGKQFVFGLPGNPVSTFVAFELFVNPVLKTLQGLGPGTHPIMRGRLEREVIEKSGRTTFLPAVVADRGGGVKVDPVPWKGSADIFSMVGANGLIVVPLETERLSPGDLVDIILFEQMDNFPQCTF
ncbi:MAG: molybdopterin molybdotransferase MoeA [Acidobacteriia bacterium]|nr:molybdopterin molybdotransferase MoeA [Terriglobia bacterium]